MGKGLLFFCCSCCILVLTIINLSVGPIISKRLGSDWGVLNCKEKKDDKDTAEDQAKKSGGQFTDKADKYYQSQIDWCTRAKGMHDMEYTAFIFDIVIGFICSLVGLLHLFDLKKDFVSNTGLIGLICGVVGFVLTFVYVIFNGLVFTGKYSDVLERDGDGIYAERTSLTATQATYKCINFDDSGDSYSGYAKYSDLNKKQYNYKKDFYDSDEAQNCEDNEPDDSGTTISYYSNCLGYRYGETFDISLPVSSGELDPNECKNIYAPQIGSITNKDIFDRFLTALILSLIVCLANIGLALFGFLLFRTPGDF